jgi:hypothetical protein
MYWTNPLTERLPHRCRADGVTRECHIEYGECRFSTPCDQPLFTATAHPTRYIACGLPPPNRTGWACTQRPLGRARDRRTHAIRPHTARPPASVAPRVAALTARCSPHGAVQCVMPHCTARLPTRCTPNGPVAAQWAWHWPGGRHGARAQRRDREEPQAALQEPHRSACARARAHARARLVGDRAGAGYRKCLAAPPFGTGCAAPPLAAAHRRVRRRHLRGRDRGRGREEEGAGRRKEGVRQTSAYAVPAAPIPVVKSAQRRCAGRTGGLTHLCGGSMHRP